MIFSLDSWLLGVVEQPTESIFIFYAMRGILGIFYLISIVCLWKLWGNPISVLSRVLWTFVLLIPMFGPIFYGGLFRLPPIQPEDQRAHGRYYGGG